MDNITPAQRSRVMARIKSKDTKPEFVVRSLAHHSGYRFRLHRRDLPGTPDLVFPSRRKVVFVHGCFWHKHPGCAMNHIPKTRRSYWAPKLLANRRRDLKNTRLLKAAGWKVEVVWECETREPSQIKTRLRSFLGRRYITRPKGSI